MRVRVCVRVRVYAHVFVCACVSERVSGHRVPSIIRAHFKLEFIREAAAQRPPLTGGQAEAVVAVVLVFREAMQSGGLRSIHSLPLHLSN